MFKRLGLVALLLTVSADISAKVTIHPTFTLLESFTPHTAVSRTKYSTDYYTSIGASVDFVINDKLTISPGYQFGIDVIDNQTGTYSDPTLILGYLFTDIFEERFKFMALLSNVGGYHSEIYGLGSHFIFSKKFEMEITPQYFADTINTQQIEVDGDFDITLSKLIQFNMDMSVGRTFVSHVRNLTSYAAGGGLTFSPLDHLKVFVSAVFAHGINTDTPYSILNSTSTVNTQSGSRVIDPGNTALDPNGNTININVGTTLDF